MTAVEYGNANVAVAFSIVLDLLLNPSLYFRFYLAYSSAAQKAREHFPLRHTGSQNVESRKLNTCFTTGSLGIV
jgi:hypothetical protein